MRVKIELDDGTLWDLEHVEEVTDGWVIFNREHLGYSSEEPFDVSVTEFDSRLVTEIQAAYLRWKIAERLDCILWEAKDEDDS